MLPEEYKVVTATDEHAGEIGTIYQACNFHYIGSMRENNPNVNSRENDRFGVEINGKLYTARSMRQKIGSQKKTIFCDVFLMQNLCRKHLKRYFYFFRK